MTEATAVRLPQEFGPYPFWIVEQISDGQVDLSTDDGHEITIPLEDFIQYAEEI